MVARGVQGRVLALGLILVSFTGCQHATRWNLTADYPEAEQFPQLYQQKAMAARHWQIIAEREATELIERFPSLPSLMIPPAMGDGDYREPDFSSAYRNLLTSELIRNGATVFSEGQGYRVDYDVQLVEFDHRSELNLPVAGLTGGSLSAYVINQVADNWSTPARLLLPVSIGADVARYFSADTHTPDTEIVLTTKVRSENQILYSHTSIYYVRMDDKRMYADTQRMKVRGRSSL